MILFIQSSSKAYKHVSILLQLFTSQLCSVLVNIIHIPFYLSLSLLCCIVYNRYLVSLTWKALRVRERKRKKLIDRKPWLVLIKNAQHVIATASCIKRNPFEYQFKSYSQQNIMRAIARRRGTQSREGTFFYSKWHQTANINDLTAHSPR